MKPLLRISTDTSDLGECYTALDLVDSRGCVQHGAIAQVITKMTGDGEPYKDGTTLLNRIIDAVNTYDARQAAILALEEEIKLLKSGLAIARPCVMAVGRGDVVLNRKAARVADAMIGALLDE